MWNWIRARASEPSTWAGVGTLVATAAQAYGTGGKAAAIGAVVSGVLAVLMKEKAQ
jgi:hypothetical protein